METQEDHQSTGIITPSDIPTDQRRHLRHYRSRKRFHRGPRSLANPLLGGLPRYGKTFDPLYASSVHFSSVCKSDRLPEHMRQMIDEICLPTNRERIALASSGTCG